VNDRLARCPRDFLDQTGRVDQLVDTGRATVDADAFLPPAVEALLVRFAEIMARLNQEFPDLTHGLPTADSANSRPPAVSMPTATTASMTTWPGRS